MLLPCDQVRLCRRVWHVLSSSERRRRYASLAASCFNNHEPGQDNRTITANVTAAEFQKKKRNKKEPRQCFCSPWQTFGDNKLSLLACLSLPHHITLLQRQRSTKVAVKLSWHALEDLSCLAPFPVYWAELR